MIPRQTRPDYIVITHLKHCCETFGLGERERGHSQRVRWPGRYHDTDLKVVALLHSLVFKNSSVFSILIIFGQMIQWTNRSILKLNFSEKKVSLANKSQRFGGNNNNNNNTGFLVTTNRQTLGVWIQNYYGYARWNDEAQISSPIF